ncbi:hypothetical protein [Aliivibrio fischeri]|uniref:hypothetical protein n=1 Tax=Aliivibrio fischeri TaxID=668 RepID=UPI0012DAF145|nr:hypothetical protein [Aliivibrio fischeri]MUL11793.1 hypothetical protein [Aliivibrio fischeri]MUL15353.1 hypothetical protein [Aliivibrio fischeri]
MKYYLLLSVVLVLTGCVNATMTTSPVSKFGPVEQENNKKGVIEYLDNSQIMDSIRKANRESAYKQMFDVCEGKYTIVNEFTRTDAEVKQSSLFSEVKMTDRYKVIEFQCL